MQDYFFHLGHVSQNLNDQDTQLSCYHQPYNQSKPHTSYCIKTPEKWRFDRFVTKKSDTQKNP